MKYRWKNILIWSFVIIVIIATAWLVTVPKIQKVINAGKVSGELNMDLREHLNYIKKLKEAQKDKAVIDAQKVVWDNLIPAQPQQDLFTVMLEDLNAASPDITKPTISFELRPKPVARINLPSGVTAYGFNISGQGSYGATLGYLDNLAKLNRLVAIERYSLTPSDELFSFTIQGVIFNQKTTPDNEKISELVFLEKMQEVSESIIKFDPIPDIESVPLGRDNPFQQ